MSRRERGHFELDRPGQARLGGEIADLEGRGLRHAPVLFGNHGDVEDQIPETVVAGVDDRKLPFRRFICKEVAREGQRFGVQRREDRLVPESRLPEVAVAEPRRETGVVRSQAVDLENPASVVRLSPGVEIRTERLEERCNAGEADAVRIAPGGRFGDIFRIFAHVAALEVRVGIDSP